MRSFRDLSLKSKLTLVLTLTSVLVLSAAFLAFFFFERASSRAALARDLASLAEVVSANSTAALSFEDARSATEILSTLRLRPNVESAALYTASGQPFASYRRTNAAAEPLPSAPGPPGSRVEAGHLLLYHPVVHGDERIGMLFMRADTAELDARLRRYGAAVLVLMLLGAAGTVLLAGRMQAVISRPILQLARAAEAVSVAKDYSIRVPREGDDEIGGLTEAFNGMLSQIEIREAQLQHQAFHDALTGISNRALLNDRLALALVQAHRSRHSVAVLFLDLDRFKLVNDSLGHSIGDDLLRAVAVRLQGTIREADTLARLGGDEFLFVLPSIHGEADAALVAAKILHDLRRPFVIAGRELFVTASIGISLYPVDGTDGETLIKNADVAMYRAKEQGRDSYHLYKPELHRRAVARMTLENQLRAAAARQEFRLYYQPIVDFRTGAIVGSEALIRWNHPERGLVLPAEFIPVAEETGLIHSLGAWVLRTGCAQAQAWDREGHPPIRVSVNLSARQLQNEELVPQIAGILEETGLDPGRLELEITESVAMENADHTVVTLNRMKRLGLRLTIDDFGTGYSSLSYLKKFPLHALKIDRSFVQDITTDPKDFAVALAIIALGRGLSIDVIAEGVETEEQRALLKAHGCDALQGFLFSRPLPPDAFSALLGRHSPVGYN